jgi:hypothetical protein
MNTSQLIAYLHSINIGDLDGIRTKLDAARHACQDLGQDELAGILSEAEQALGRADMKTYRKRIETVVARLGHLR